MPDAPLDALSPFPGVHVFERVKPSGWGLSMLTVALPDRGLLIYSPTWLGEGTFEAIEALGQPRVLVAPNHFHHLSLSRFRERYPGALVVASAGATPRLSARGHEGLAPLDRAAPLLPPGAHFLAPPALKNGEVWLSLPGEGGPCWLQCDAFFHVRRPLSGLEGMMLRALRTAPGPCMGDTFRWVGVDDPRAYAHWTLDALERERPAIFVPCHGEPLGHGGAALAHERFALLLRERLVPG